MERDDDMLVALRVAAIVSNRDTGQFNLVLHEVVGERRITMTIGQTEAQAIAVFMEGVSMPRPLTHDLIAKMLDTFDIKVSRIIIENMNDGYFTSSIVFDAGNKPYVVDARTSDAVAIAVRCQAAIFAREEVMRIAGYTPADLRRAMQPRPLKELNIEELQEKLQKAVATEDYMQAQRIKDVMDKKRES